MNRHLHKYSSQAGFTLVDILVAGTILAVMSGVLLANFSKSRLNLNESANIIISSIREAEVKTTSSTIYASEHRCGYGLKKNNSTSIDLYVGPAVNDPAYDCSEKRYTTNRGYSILKNTKLVDPRVEIKGETEVYGDLDVFFTPPEPKTYTGPDEYRTFAQESTSRVVLGRVGKDCSEDKCLTICIYGTGRIEKYSGQATCE